MKNGDRLQDRALWSCFTSAHAGHEARRTRVMEVEMKTPKFTESAKSAILAIAEIKAAVAAFDRGEANACDVLEAVREALPARAVAAWIPPRTARPRRRVA